MSANPLPSPTREQIIEIIEAAAAGANETTPVSVQDRAVDGATFVLDVPTEVPAVWGRGGQVAWAQGEPCMIYAPQGTGKSALAQQLVLARVGIRSPSVLDLDVAVDERPVFYFAGDRPQQVRRSLRRMVGENDRAALAERLIAWPGPLPFVVTKDHQALANFVLERGAGTLVVDSLKDLAVGLADDEVGAAVNLAIQHVIAAGIEVLDLHHPRKSNAANPRPRTLDDVYGSTWLTSGHGSVLLLWGKPGDPIVELEHIKPPAAEVDPFKLVHDFDTGRSVRYQPLDLLDLIQSEPDGLTARDAAAHLYSGTKPSDNEREKARRRLEKLADAGKVHRRDGSGPNDPTRYYSVRPREGQRDVSREDHAPLTDPLTHPSRTVTEPLSDPATPCKGAGDVSVREGAEKPCTCARPAFSPRSGGRAQCQKCHGWRETA